MAGNDKPKKIGTKERGAAIAVAEHLLQRLESIGGSLISIGDDDDMQHQILRQWGTELMGLAEGFSQNIQELSKVFVEEQAEKAIKKIAASKRKRERELEALILDEPGLDLCNKTEILQILGMHGYFISRSTDLETCKKILRGEKDVEEFSVVDQLKGTINNLIRQDWKNMEGQLSCDADCYMCPSCKVTECYLDNKAHLNGRPDMPKFKL
ncbi:hypothetical protein LCGC14_0147370 [marine sediment metagenome]|uniref:Uncharacterized protein n=1 Tax=marine sediment metagenome TaxID=412755 RepID=A0A0F9V076_9ZZZZ